MSKSRDTQFAKPFNYQTYILHLWQEQSDDPDEPAWRFAIEDPKRGSRYGFSSLNELINFLHKQIDGKQK